MSLISCDHCKGRASWTVIDGLVHYYCRGQCDGFAQLDVLEPNKHRSVGKPTLAAEGNFPHVSEYEEREERDGGLPF